MENEPSAGEKKKPVPKDVFGRKLPTEEQFEVLKNAPKYVWIFFFFKDCVADMFCV